MYVCAHMCASVCAHMYVCVVCVYICIYILNRGHFFTAFRERREREKHRCGREISMGYLLYVYVPGPEIEPTTLPSYWNNIVQVTGRCSNERSHTSHGEFCMFLKEGSKFLQTSGSVTLALTWP